jgi:hypothetical protein
MTTANENSPGKPEGVITSPPATCSAHPWSLQFSNRQRIAAAKREGIKRRAKERARELAKDPIYQAVITERHVAWEKEKYHHDPKWAAARKEYYKNKRQESAPNESSSGTASERKDKQ